MKHILTIQDLSCVGKCSLTVALPVISAMGVEISPLPTALLSNHTAFPEFSCRDLTAEIMPIVTSWRHQGITFDGIYTGYLGSVDQVEEVKRVCKEWKKPHTLMVTDPAMGDDGVLYANLDEIFVRRMAELCAMADIILPNVTEACFLTGTAYREDYDSTYIEELLKKTASLGAGYVVLTGVIFPTGIGVMGMNSKTGEIFSYQREKIGAGSPGTGDVFASAFVGALARNLQVGNAIALAVDFTVESIRLTQEDDDKRWYGINFEEAIPYLLQRIGALH